MGKIDEEKKSEEIHMSIPNQEACDKWIEEVWLPLMEKVKQKKNEEDLKNKFGK